MRRFIAENDRPYAVDPVVGKCGEEEPDAPGPDDSCVDTKRCGDGYAKCVSVDEMGGGLASVCEFIASRRRSF